MAEASRTLRGFEGRGEPSPALVKLAREYKQSPGRREMLAPHIQAEFGRQPADKSGIFEGSRKQAPSDADPDLLTAIRREGGIGQDADLSGELRRIGQKESGSSGLTNKQSKVSPDEMRAMMKSEGLTEAETVSEFLDEVEGHLRSKREGGGRPTNLEAEFREHYEDTLTDAERADSDALTQALKRKPFERAFNEIQSFDKEPSDGQVENFRKLARQAGLSRQGIEELIEAGRSYRRGGGEGAGLGDAPLRQEGAGQEEAGGREEVRRPIRGRRSERGHAQMLTDAANALAGKKPLHEMTRQEFEYAWRQSAQTEEGVPLKKLTPEQAKNWVGYEGQKTLKVYRGVRSGSVKERPLAPGDFVTTSPEAAKQYGDKVVEMEVPAAHLRYFKGTKAGDPERLGQGGQVELIYAPERGKFHKQHSVLGHRRIIEQAIREGKQVPEAVLKNLKEDYPDFDPEAIKAKPAPIRPRRSERGVLRLGRTEAEAKRFAAIKAERAKKNEERLKKVSTLQAGAQLLTPKFAIRNVASQPGMFAAENASNAIASALDAAYAKLTGKGRQVTLASPSQQAKGYKLGLQEAKLAKQQGKPLQNATAYAQEPAFKGKAGKKLEDLLYYVNNVPDNAAFRGHFLGALDNLTRAQKKGGHQGLSRQDFIDQAWIEAKRATFQDENFISKRLSKLKETLNFGKPWGLGDLVIKYPNIPGGILRRGVEYSPLGFIDAALEASKPGPFRRRNTLMALSRASLGSVAGTGLGAALFGMGILTGPEDDKAQASEMQREAGFGQYRLNASALKRWAQYGFDFNKAMDDPKKLRPGDELWSIDWFQPYAMTLAAGAGVAHSLKDKDLSHAPTAVKDSLAAFLDAFNDQSVVKNLTRYIGKMSLTDALIKSVKDAPASFAPGILNQVRQYIDPVRRDTRAEKPGGIEGHAEEAAKKVAAKLPGLSSKLAPRPGVFGQQQQYPQEKHRTIFNTFFNPSLRSTYEPTPLGEEMQRLGVAASGPQRAKDKKTGEVEPTSKLRGREAEYGQKLEQAGRALVESDVYKNAKDEEKKLALEGLRRAIADKDDRKRPANYSPGRLISNARQHRIKQERKERMGQ
ncbi:MAG TPA: hypothetical protein VD948_11360 [Rhodothermales bacterium]|nr:hypothetical protein [Rhodothermales bacterium]